MLHPMLLEADHLRTPKILVLLCCSFSVLIRDVQRYGVSDMYLKFLIHIFLASSSSGISDTQGNILSILQEKQRKELGEMH